MPSIRENQEMWGEKYDWSKAGDEWSVTWGSPDMQWYYSIFPRIHSWLPTGTILEIGAGFGRWTQFLIGQCQHMILVDLSQVCIDACRQRFQNNGSIDFHVNDGLSLDFIPDRSVDFAFSFDSLVHAESDVISAYLSALAKILRPDGVAFLHHSNFQEQSAYLARLQPLPYRVKRVLARYNLIETLEEQWRAKSMTASRFEEQARQAGLVCIGQEIINWKSRHLIDCISQVTPLGSRWARENRVVRNPNFMREASYAVSLSDLYERDVT